MAVGDDIDLTPPAEGVDPELVRYLVENFKRLQGVVFDPAADIEFTGLATFSGGLVSTNTASFSGSTSVGRPKITGEVVPLELLAGRIKGFVPTNNATDPNNDIDLSAGVAVSADGSKVAYQTAAMTKRLDAAWAAGVNQGGLFTGAKANNTWYHGHVIRHNTTYELDWGFDTSVTGANVPSGYSVVARAFSCRTDGSGNILGFQAMPIAGGALRVEYRASQTEWAAVTQTLNTWTTRNLAYVPPSVYCMGDHGFTVGSAFAAVALWAFRAKGGTEAGGTTQGHTVMRTYSTTTGANGRFEVAHFGLATPSLESHNNTASVVAGHNFGGYTNGYTDFREAA